MIHCLLFVGQQPLDDGPVRFYSLLTDLDFVTDDHPDLTARVLVGAAQHGSHGVVHHDDGADVVVLKRDDEL